MLQNCTPYCNRLPQLDSILRREWNTYMQNEIRFYCEKIFTEKCFVNFLFFAFI